MSERIQWLFDVSMCTVSTFGGSLPCVQFDHLRSSTVWLPKMGINNSIINKYISNRIVLGAAIITFSPWSNEKIISSVQAFEENHLTYGSFAFSPTRTLFCVAFQMFSTLIFGVCVCTESKENIWTIFFSFSHKIQRRKLGIHWTLTTVCKDEEPTFPMLQVFECSFKHCKCVTWMGRSLFYSIFELMELLSFIENSSKEIVRNSGEIFSNENRYVVFGYFSDVSSSLLLYILQRILQSIK